MARLARCWPGRPACPRPSEWLEKALKLAPSRKELRLAFIEQLVDDQRYAEAIQQYAALDKAEPNNPDYLRDWGKLVLRDLSRPKARAARRRPRRIWRRMVAARPNDPLVATQVADLLRHAECRKRRWRSIKGRGAAPDAAAVSRVSGRVLPHSQAARRSAQATWQKIAEGKLRTAANVTRLAEVLSQFGYLEQALPEIAAACELDPKDFSLQLKAADLQIRGEHTQRHWRRWPAPKTGPERRRARSGARASG